MGRFDPVTVKHRVTSLKFFKPELPLWNGKLKNNEVIGLKAITGKYLQSKNEGYWQGDFIEAEADSFDPAYCSFRVRVRDDSKIYLIREPGAPKDPRYSNYLRNDGSWIRPTGPTIGSTPPDGSCVFEVIGLNGLFIALKADNGHYWSVNVQANNKIVVNEDKEENATRFTIIR